MQIKLLNVTPLNICSHAIRTCWQSFDKSDAGGEKDIELIDRVGNKLKHASTLEHIYFNFYIQGISRACLQELSRHRIASLSVKSSRYTLKELKNFTGNYEKYLVFIGDENVDNASKNALDNLIKILKSGTSNDMAKYCMPESFKTELTWSINARSLQNFIELRSSKYALKEIRKLALALFEAVPKDYRFLFVERVQKVEND